MVRSVAAAAVVRNMTVVTAAIQDDDAGTESADTYSTSSVLLPA
jgi:hypothetical protein